VLNPVAERRLQAGVEHQVDLDTEDRFHAQAERLPASNGRPR
jgi:hypothetical protein